MRDIMTSRWIAFPRANPKAKTRLICFPCAGRGASLYRTWPGHLGKDVEVCAIQPPGRENRIGDPPLTRFQDLLSVLAEVLQPFLDREYAIFGHSLGALIGFEVARRIREIKGITPIHLFASAQHAPQIPDPMPPISMLPDVAFLTAVQQRYDGIPHEVLREPEVLSLLLPMLRADFQILEDYSYHPEHPLACGITALGGLEDTVTSPEQLSAWGLQTQGVFRFQMFPGDHFFVQSAEKEVLDCLSSELSAATKIASGTCQ
jgi:medium-chain acyl-[acyl-carrier-protein] hydrolase